MRHFLIGLLGFGLALGAQGQETGETIAGGLAADSDMAGCLYQAEMQGKDREGCIGIIAVPCLEDAVSTFDQVSCVGQETEFWDTRLNLKYNELRGAYMQQDRDDPDSYIQMAPLLKSTQLQWIKWRDAKCKGFERNRFRGGTLGRVTGADCLMTMTATRVFELEDLLAEARM